MSSGPAARREQLEAMTVEKAVERPAVLSTPPPDLERRDAVGKRRVPSP
jgi:hypothetical protein